MDAERWRKIEQLCHAALEREAGESEGSADPVFGSAACRLEKVTSGPYPDLHVPVAAPFPSDRFFFLTVRLLPTRRDMMERDFACLERCLDAVRSRRRFLLTAWVFLLHHWHAMRAGRES